jgi:hypothetical protein
VGLEDGEAGVDVLEGAVESRVYFCVCGPIHMFLPTKSGSSSFF